MSVMVLAVRYGKKCWSGLWYMAVEKEYMAVEKEGKVNVGRTTYR